MTDSPYPVLLEDGHLLVVAKPAGILTVPPSGGGAPNVADRLRRQAKARGGETFPVHRLDRDTSGVLVFAKTRQAKDALEAAFRERTVEKRYLALAHGRLRPAKGTIRSYIEDRGKTARSRAAPTRSGKPAVTRYRVVQSYAQATLVEAHPETGRLNQIRLHLADRGCPLVGERKYAVASRYPLRFKRPLLHAAGLRFPHPVERRVVVVQAPLPDDFAAYLAGLRS